MSNRGLQAVAFVVMSSNVMVVDQTRFSSAAFR